MEDIVGKGLVSMENNIPVQDIPETVPVEEITDEGSLLAMQKVNTDQMVAVETISNTLELVDDVKGAVEEITRETGTLSEEGFKMLQAVMGEISSQYKIPKQSIGLEGFVTYDDKERSMIALEGIKEIGKKVLQKILALIKWVADKAKAAGKFIVGKLSGLFKRRTEMVNEAKKTITKQSSGAERVIVGNDEEAKKDKEEHPERYEGLVFSKTVAVIDRKMFKNIVTSKYLTNKAPSVTAVMKESVKGQDFFSAMDEFIEVLKTGEYGSIQAGITRVLMFATFMSTLTIGGWEVDKDSVERVKNMPEEDRHLGLLEWKKRWDDAEVEGTTEINVLEFFDFYEEGEKQLAEFIRFMHLYAQRSETIGNHLTKIMPEIENREHINGLRNMSKSIVWLNPVRYIRFYNEMLDALAKIIFAIEPSMKDNFNKYRSAITEGMDDAAAAANKGAETTSAHM